ncbi:MAG TPA: hypothetical protein VK699_18785 [Terriglobales bacterium]|nr:hypothetical protein [Terriglobales bacterium]
MTLLEAIRDLGSFEEGSTIYAAEPWTAESQAIIAPEPDTGGLPTEAQTLGLKYFLEVFIARDFLEGWVGGLDAEPTQQEKCARLIQYATTDA